METRNLILKNCRFILTPKPNGEVRVMENKDIVIEDGVITSLGVSKNAPRGADKLYLKNHIVAPGLVNAHTHAAMSILRGYADDYELHEWLNRVWSVERKLSRRLVYNASLLSCYEMVLSGITCFQDMYPMYEETVRAACKVGVRVVAGPMCGWENISLLQGNSLFKPIVNIHSIYAVELDNVKSCIEYALKHEVKVQIHVSETRKEVYECKRRTGKFPVELLDSMECLSKNTILVHLNWVTNWEVEAISRRGAQVVVCPSSSMKLANSGFTPIHELMSKNVVVGLGCDGACSSNKLDVLSEMRQLVLLYRHNYWDTRVKAEHAFKAATINGSLITGFKCGVIAEGYKGDIIALNTKNPRLKPLFNPLSILVYSTSPCDVEYVVINGNVVVSPESREELLNEANDVWSSIEDEVWELWFNYND